MRWPISVLILVLLILTLTGLSTAQENLRFGEGDIIYFAVTDRFMNGNRSNDRIPPSEYGVDEYQPGKLSYHQGGDWEGMIQKFDYISNLGVTALWISPVVLNQKMSPGLSTSGYHGYWARDFYKPDPHFGSMENLKTLVQLAHSRGIKVILDHMLNHTGDFFKVEKDWVEEALKEKVTPLELYKRRYGRLPNPHDPSSPIRYHMDPDIYGENYKAAPPFDNIEWYHHYGDIRNWNDPFWNENGDLYGLDDLNHEVPEVRRELIKNAKWWIQEVGFDALRLDAAKHFPKDFLKEFTSEVGRPCFGEVWVGNPAELAEYEHNSWSMIDFPLYYAIRDVFVGEAPTERLHEILSQDRLYNHPNRLVTFISNQDVPRFQSYVPNKADYSKIKLALSFLFTCRGIPMIYYGDEQGFSGGKDPANREPMFDPFTGEPKYFNENHELYRWIQRLCHFRLSHEALKFGRQLETFYGRWVYAFERISENEELLVVVNNSPSPQDEIVPLSGETRIGENQLLIDLFREKETIGEHDLTVVVTEGGKKQIYVNLPPKSIRVFAPISRENLQNYLSAEEIDRLVNDVLRAYRAKLRERELMGKYLFLGGVLGTATIGFFLLWRRRK
jgi:glycosidase